MFNKTKIQQTLSIVWVLVVLGTLWGASALMLMGTRHTVPRNVTLAMVAATFGLGFIWLIRHIKPATVVE